MALDEHYICQRAANAIISEIGPFRVSTDALQAINQFLDEFICLLLTSSQSLDLSQLKLTVVNLLPSTLGKNAIVEAELEVKTFTESEDIDYELYERMRYLEVNESILDEALKLLREKCFEYCTLADRDDQIHLQKPPRKRNEMNTEVAISPIVAIYVTTVMEHIAEYLLTAVAMTAEHEDTDYVRVKEVFQALIDDIQLGNVFDRMDLRDKMEKRVGLQYQNKIRASYIPPPSPSPRAKKSYNFDNIQQETGSFLDITFDDLDTDYFNNNKRKSIGSTTSRIPEIIRPHSAMSSSTNYNFNTIGSNASGNRKSTFHLFKNNRNSFSGGDVSPRASSPVGVPSVYDPDSPTMNFDELIKSGGTVKVSLTPNRLRSIEVKDLKEDLAPPPVTWERRSNSSPRLTAANSSRPSSPLAWRENPSNNNNNKDLSLDLKKKASYEVPKLSARPLTPSSPLGRKTFVKANEIFENPREAPKPPVATTSEPLSPTIAVASPLYQISKSTSSSTAVSLKAPGSPIKSPTPSIKNGKAATPLPKLQANSPQVSYSAPKNISKSVIMTKQSSESIASDISSVLSIPSPVTPVPAPPSDRLSSSIVVPTGPSVTSLATTTSIQESSSLPRPARPTTPIINTSGVVLRRSSSSSKKSRDILRKKDEQKTSTDESAPADTTDSKPVAITPSEPPTFVLTEEPTEINEFANTSRQVRFNDNSALSTDDENLVLNKKLNNAVPTSTTSTPDSPTVATKSIVLNTISKSTPTALKRSNTTNIPSTAKEKSMSSETSAIPRMKANTLAPEPPSSIAARRASMVNRRQSLHEPYTAEKNGQDSLRQRISNVGSVSNSIKQWDDISKPVYLDPQQPQINVIPPAAHRRSILRQLRQQQQQQKGESGNSEASSESGALGTENAVLNKVLKFERASSQDDDAHKRVSHMPRRERFLYLQQDPSTIERKSTIQKKSTHLITTKRLNTTVIGIDQACQTDPLEEEEYKKTKKSKADKEKKNESSEDEEQGEVDGDEEWFLQDDEWDDQEEAIIVEWLLGE